VKQHVLVQNLSWKKPNTLQTVRTKFEQIDRVDHPGQGSGFLMGVSVICVWCHVATSCCQFRVRTNLV
jgi:hypothetical protein